MVISLVALMFVILAGNHALVSCLVHLPLMPRHSIRDTCTNLERSSRSCEHLPLRFYPPPLTNVSRSLRFVMYVAYYSITLFFFHSNKQTNRWVGYKFSRAESDTRKASDTHKAMEFLIDHPRRLASPSLSMPP